jgi:hypothetical protein
LRLWFASQPISNKISRLPAQVQNTRNQHRSSVFAPVTDLYVYYPSRRNLAVRLRAFIKFLVERLGSGA